MSDNDLIRRGDVLSAFETEFNGKGEECYWFGGCREEVVEVVKTVPTVPHEMTAREYLMVRTRMCYKYESCEGCPLNIINEKYNCLCFSVESQSQEEAVAIVEEWAREHPEEEDDGE